MGDSDTNCNWRTWNKPQRLGKMTEGNGIQRKNWDQLEHRIVEIGQNIEYSPENQNRLAVTQPHMKDHQLTLVWKTRNSKNNNDNNKYLDLTSNLKVTVIPIIVEALGTIPKTMQKRIAEVKIYGRSESIHISEKLRSARKLRKVMKNLDLLSVVLQRRPLVCTRGKSHKE